MNNRRLKIEYQCETNSDTVIIRLRSALLAMVCIARLRRPVVRAGKKTTERWGQPLVRSYHTGDLTVRQAYDFAAAVLHAVKLGPLLANGSIRAKHYKGDKP